jgi:hypothetical protein
VAGAGADVSVWPPGWGQAAPGRDRPMRRAEIALWVGLGVAIAVVLAASAVRFHANPILAALTAGLVLVAGQRLLLAWPMMLAYVLAVILFIPIRRYTIGGGLPIALEPYRFVVAIVLGAWFAALLVDDRVKLQRTGLEAPLLVIVAAMLGSVVVNVQRVIALDVSDIVFKQLTFFISFILIAYLAASAVTRRADLDRLLMFVVGGGTVLAVFALVEWRTSYNFFDHIDRLFPILETDPTDVPLERGGSVRARASAQHPIALGAMLAILLPLAVYLYRRKGQRIWMASAALLVLGALATVSRTAAVMLGVELAMFLWLKRRETVRLLPMLIPLILCAQIAIPGTLGTFKAILFPKGGLVQEEKEGEGSGQGRVADLGPALEEWARKPLLGQGFGTRLTSPDDPKQNAQILDDQWMSSLLEIGAVGVFGLLWLYVGSIRRLAQRAKGDATSDGWLLAALASALAAFAIGMVTYDGFSFIQVTFISFALLGFASAALRVLPRKA